MQKVVGSSPIIRSSKPAETAGFLLSELLPELLFTVRPPYSGILSGLENMRFQRDCCLPARALVEVPVALEDERAAVRVTHLLGDHLDVAACGDHERGAGVAEVVER